MGVRVPQGLVSFYMRSYVMVLHCIRIDPH